MRSFTLSFIVFNFYILNSFLLRPQTTLFDRRHVKILTKVVSSFTSAFVYNWSNHFDIPLAYPPVFDARCITYPIPQNVRDYFSWRQVDSKVNISKPTKRNFNLIKSLQHT